MKLLADENFPVASFKALKTKDYDIRHIGVELSSIRDEEVISIAIAEDRIILTFDRDFGELVFKEGYRPKGVVYFRWKEFRPLEPGEFIDELIQEKRIELDGNFTVIDPDQIRQRRI
ncbi:MAG: DUF5615 family PIN-like protein [Bacteroidota bacterium]